LLGHLINILYMNRQIIVQTKTISKKGYRCK
jgi:hypothetical protein